MADMLMVATLETSDKDLKTYKQAIRLPDANKWLEACAAEVVSLVENKVYEVVDRLASHQVITSKWVFKKKRGLTGAVEKYKARIVARGFMLGPLPIGTSVSLVSTPTPHLCASSECY